MLLHSMLKLSVVLDIQSLPWGINLDFTSYLWLVLCEDFISWIKSSLQHEHHFVGEGERNIDIYRDFFPIKAQNFMIESHTSLFIFCGWELSKLCSQPLFLVIISLWIFLENCSKPFHLYFDNLWICRKLRADLLDSNCSLIFFFILLFYYFVLLITQDGGRGFHSCFLS